MLVNTGILPQESDPFIRGFAEIGIVLIMFALGFEESAEHFVQSIRRSRGVAFFGAIAPFITAYVLADFYWADYHIPLMCRLAMTATAVSLTLVSLKSERFIGRPAATGVMTSAVLDDIASLALVAVLLPVATGETTIRLRAMALIGFKAVSFFYHHRPHWLVYSAASTDRVCQ